MKIKILLTSTVAVVMMVAFSGCTAALNAAPNGPDDTGAATEQTDIGRLGLTRIGRADDGTTVEVVAGSIVEVRLESNPTTGFRWKLAGELDERMLALIQSGYVPGKDAEGQVVGAGGVEVWTFETLAAGDATIHLDYSRPWEGGEKGVDTFTVTLRSLSSRLPE